jgi:protein-tyrosine-phosphatase
MAAAILRLRLTRMGLADQVKVESAGVWAREGQPAAEGAVTALASLDIPLADHRSQLLTHEPLDRADIVLVMEEAHRRSIFYLAPQQLRKVWLLSELSGVHDDIEDPYGGPASGYVNTATQLQELIEAGLPRLFRQLQVALPTADSDS